ALQHIDRGLAPSQLSEYSISASQTQKSGDPTPIFQISKGPNAVVSQTLQPNGTVLYTGCTTGTLNGATIPTCGSRSATYINPNIKNAYSMTWNYAMQYQLTHNP